MSAASPRTCTPSPRSHLSAGFSGIGADGSPRKGNRTWHPLSAENQQDLLQFLKVVSPKWSCARKSGHRDVQRVLEKLKDIGVHNTFDLLQRVSQNSINEDLSAAGHSRFSKDTMDRMQKQSHFIRSLEHLKEPYFRQVGVFAPVPQLMTGTNLRQKAWKTSCTAGEFEGGVAGRRPATSDGTGTVACGLRLASQEACDMVQPSALEPCPALALVGLRRYSRTLSDVVSDCDQNSPSHSDGTRSPKLFLRLATSRSDFSHSTSSRHAKLRSLDSPLAWSDSSFSVFSTGARSPATSLGESDPEGMGSSQLHQRRDSVTDSSLSLDPTEFVSKWTKLGDQIKQEPWAAKWASGRSLLHNADSIFREQSALDERKALRRAISLQGKGSTLRSHISTKIRSRLKEEEERDAQGALDVQQRSMNIRKNLGLMQASRRELCEQKRKVQDAVVGPQAKMSTAHAEMFKMTFRGSMSLSGSGESDVLSDTGLT